MNVSDFDYHLPEELIAQHPLEPRDSSRLMVLNRGSGDIEHRVFRDLVEYLRPEDVLVVNDSKVIPGRLFGRRKDTGGRVEVLLLTRTALDKWEVLVRPGRRVPPGIILEFGGGELEAEVLHRTPAGGRVLRFHFSGSFEETLDRLGEMPLPPYIHEKLSDPSRYQTVYAREDGSAAAPTAGLHFTKDLLDAIRHKGVTIASITLHVGLGTFRPVSVDKVEEHEMHSEYYRVGREAALAIERAKREGGRVVCVGTTSARTLESAAGSDDTGVVRERDGWTNLFIYPGYKFQAVDALVTNFHLPKSSLMMLVSAFAGREFIMHAYETAVREKYRFFSFGDAMLIL